MTTLIQICGGASILMIALFVLGIIRGGIREQLRPPRKPGLGREIRLSAMNYMTVYTGGIYTMLDEFGQKHVFYQTEQEREVAERNFPDDIIQPMTAEDLFHFEHPNR